MINKLNLDDIARMGVIPLIVHDNDNEEKTNEVIICTGISGGANYKNNMPESMELSRYLADGRIIRKRYIQEK